MLVLIKVIIHFEFFCPYSCYFNLRSCVSFHISHSSYPPFSFFIFLIFMGNLCLLSVSLSLIKIYFYLLLNLFINLLLNLLINLLLKFIFLQIYFSPQLIILIRYIILLIDANSSSLYELLYFFSY